MSYVCDICGSAFDDVCVNISGHYEAGRQHEHDELMHWIDNDADYNKDFIESISDALGNFCYRDTSNN